MSNRLAKEMSPYLRQHAENPVDWYPWGEEAFRKARNEDKPIHLSVGYGVQLKKRSKSILYSININLPRHI